MPLTSSLEKKMPRFSVSVIVCLCITSLCCLGGIQRAQAEYSTPGLGFSYTLDQLVAQSGGAVTGNNFSYQINDSVVISPTDLLTISEGTTLVFMDSPSNIGLEVNGRLHAFGSENLPIVFTGNTPAPGTWRGLDFNNTNSSSEFQLSHVEIAYSTIAVDVFGGDIEIDHCEIHHSLEKAIDISSADGLITNCHLHHNQQRTVTMTLTSSPVFENCFFEHNNQENSSPYPYFNVGLQGVNSPTIRNCTIEGNGNQMSGGMAFWASCQALIENNSISGCGYGILCYSTDANPTLYNNHIFDNTIHPDTVNWGFGVACNGNNAPVLAENTIEGHWYGVAAVNGGQPNLGDITNASADDDGLNVFRDNGINGYNYAFFNNTPLQQMAQNNIWGPDGTLDEAENSIVHFNDDASLGLVIFDPVAVDPLVPVIPSHRLLEQVSAYPNPFNPRVEIKMTLSHSSLVKVAVVDIAGRLIKELSNGVMNAGPQILIWDGNDGQGKASASGLYFYRIVAGNESRLGKLLLVR